VHGQDLPPPALVRRGHGHPPVEPAGVAEIAAAFAAGEPAGTRALFILAGLISVAFGVVLCARPHMGAITVALLFGLFNLIAGIWMIVQGIEVRRTGKTLDSALPEKQPA
jgi:Short repeat of unknown function (DUF308)